MKDRRSLVGEAKVAAFEQRFGFTLPDDYRRFLLEVNGGYLASENKRLSHLIVSGLLSLTEDTEEGLEGAASRAQWYLPHSDLIQIGSTGSGVVVLAVRGDHRGEIYNLDTVDPRPDEANPRVLWHDRRDMTKLASSFEELVRLLKPLE